MTYVKPKIAILVPRYGISDRGVENFTKELVNHLEKEFDFDIFSWRTFFPNLKLSPSYTEFEMFLFSLIVAPFLLLGRYRLLFPQNGFWGAAVCRLVRFFSGTPFIYRSAGGKEPMIVRQKPNCYIATTPEIGKWIGTFDRKARVFLIPNGVNRQVFSKFGKKAKINLEKPIFLCAGALISPKRIGLAIRAVSKLKEGSLLVLGEGAQKESLDTLGKKLLGKERFEIRKVNYRSMPAFYRTSDVFTLPSKEEPFGMVYIEAMASGVPVVAPEDASREYIIGRGGKLCNVEKTEEYSETLKRVFTERKRFARMAGIQAQRFDWKIVAGKYRDIFNSFIRSGS